MWKEDGSNNKTTSYQQEPNRRSAGCSDAKAGQRMACARMTGSQGSSITWTNRNVVNWRLQGAQESFHCRLLMAAVAAASRRERNLFHLKMFCLQQHGACALPNFHLIQPTILLYIVWFIYIFRWYVYYRLKLSFHMVSSLDPATNQSLEYLVHDSYQPTQKDSIDNQLL